MNEERTSPLPVVLVVEDEPVVLEVLERMLGARGFALDKASSFADALDRMAAGACSAMITDIMIPGGTGDDLLREMRRLNPHVPVAIITGYATVDLTLNLLLEGAFDFLPKPFSFEEVTALASRFRRILSLPCEQRAAILGWGPAPRGSRLCLRGHSWVERSGESGLAAGMGPLLVAAAGEVVDVRLPDPGDALVMGQHCAFLRDGEGLEHGMRAPMSGNVVQTVAPEELLGAQKNAYFKGERPLFTLEPTLYRAEAARLAERPGG